MVAAYSITISGPSGPAKNTLAGAILNALQQHNIAMDLTSRGDLLPGIADSFSKAADLLGGSRVALTSDTAVAAAIQIDATYEPQLRIGDRVRITVEANLGQGPGVDTVADNFVDRLRAVVGRENVTVTLVQRTPKVGDSVARIRDGTDEIGTVLGFSRLGRPVVEWAGGDICESPHATVVAR